MLAHKSHNNISRKTITIQNVENFFGKEGKYKIDIENPIHDFSSNIVTAYPIISLSGNKTESFYILVSKIPQLLDFEKIQIVGSCTAIDGLALPLSYEIVNINQKEYFAALMPLISPENTLRNNIERFVGNADHIIEDVIIPLLQIIVQMNEIGVSHNCINLDSILIKNDNSIILLNSLMELPSYSQLPLFETVEQMLMHRGGKKSIDLTLDCYAIGVLILFLLSGKTITGHQIEEVALLKCKMTSYDYFINEWFGGNEQLIPEIARHLIYWLIHDNPTKRWSAEKATRFLRHQNKRSRINKVMAATMVDMEAIKNNKIHEPLLFPGEPCHNINEAAVVTWKNYDEIKMSVKNGKLVKAMLSNSDMSSEFIMEISLLRKAAVDIAEKNTLIQKDEIFLSLFLVLLNKNMPLKFRDVSVNTYGIWDMLRYIVTNRSINLSSTLQNLTCYSVADIYEALYSINADIITAKVIDSVNKMYDIITKLREEYSVNTLCHFIIGYMAPDTIYQDGILNNKICFNCLDILELLDSAGNDVFENFIENDEVICFMMGKLSVEGNDLISNKLPIPFNGLHNTREIQLLEIFSVIQTNKDKPLKNITMTLYGRLIPYIRNSINNITYRGKIDEKFKEAAESGYFSKMLKILQSKTIDIKHSQYLKILSKVEKIENKIKQNNVTISQHHIIRNTGQQFAMKIAGAIFFITLFFISYNLLVIT